jgi:hypothetical protein
MARLMRWVALVSVALALIGLGRPSYAQTTVNLNMTSSTGLTSTISGWSIAFAPLSMGSCVFKVEDPGTFTNATQSNCTGVEMVETVFHNRLYLTFEGAGGTTLESAVGSSATACAGGPCFNNFSDLNMIFTVTAPTGITVSSASLSLTGSATLSGGGTDLVTSDLAKISAGESSSAFTMGNITTNESSNPNQVTAAFSSAVNSFSVTKDLKVNGNSATPGATLALNTVMQMYSPAAPEPVSLSLFAVGIAGLAAVKLRRRNRR